jgi:hypothetical protein
MAHFRKKDSSTTPILITVVWVRANHNNAKRIILAVSRQSQDDDQNH